MKAIVSKNNRFIQLSERPKDSIIHGLKIFLDKPQNEYSLPIATCTVVRNKMRYSLKELEYPNVSRIEIKNETWDWEIIMNNK